MCFWVKICVKKLIKTVKTHFLQTVTSLCPANGKPIAEVVTGNKDDYEKCVVEAQKAWKSWAQVTAPQRGLIFEILFNYQTFL